MIKHEATTTYLIEVGISGDGFKLLTEARKQRLLASGWLKFGTLPQTYPTLCAPQIFAGFYYSFILLRQERRAERGVFKAVEVVLIPSYPILY